MKRRCQSINNHPLEEQRPLSSFLSTISVDTTRGMTSKRIDAVGMGMRKNAVIAHITVEGTTAMRTGWLPSH